MPLRRPHRSPRPPWAGLVEILNEVPAAVEHEFGPPAVQCESRASPDLLEEDGLAHPIADVDELVTPSPARLLIDDGFGLGIFCLGLCSWLVGTRNNPPHPLIGGLCF